jgi:high-affinity Fe2+/Pb2+ permease
MEEMNNQRVKPLLIIKKMTSIGVVIGVLISFFGIVESGIRMEYLLSIGISIIVSSMLLFGFGMILPLMEEASEKK